MYCYDDIKREKDYLEVHLNPPLPIPFDDIFIRIDIEPPHKIRYFVRVLGCTAKEVGITFFNEVIDTI